VQSALGPFLVKGQERRRFEASGCEFCQFP
jgi:hypothetical protein